MGSVISLGYYGSVLRALYQPAVSPKPAENPDAAESAQTDGESRGTGTAGVAVVVIAGLTVAAGLVPLLVGIPQIWRYFG